MAFRIMVQATFSTSSITSARAARDAGHKMVTALEQRNETVEKTSTTMVNERTQFRFRLELDCGDLKDLPRARNDVAAFAQGVQKLGGKLVTVRLGDENLMPKNETQLADELAHAKNVASARTEQLANEQRAKDDALKENAELRKKLGMPPRDPAAGATGKATG